MEKIRSGRRLGEACGPDELELCVYEDNGAGSREERQMEVYIVEGSDLPDVGAAKLVVLSVSKREVGGKIYARVLHVISQLEAFGVKARGCLAIVFEYDDVPDEIFEIAEIRDWVAGLLERVPHLFYFITMFGGNQNHIAACLADLDVIKKTPSMTYDQILEYASKHGYIPMYRMNICLPKRICEQIFKASLAYACRIKDDPIEFTDFISQVPSLAQGIKEILDGKGNQEKK